MYNILAQRVAISANFSGNLEKFSKNGKIYNPIYYRFL